MRSICFFVLLLIGGVSLVDAQNPFRSRQSGNWNDPSTWEEDAGGGFAATLNTPNSLSGTITIRNTHTVTITVDVTIDETTVQNGGAIIISNGFSLTLDEDFSSNPLTIDNGASLTNNGTFDLATFLIISPCVVNGNVTNSGNVSIADGSLLQFNSGSNYFHNFSSGGAIPFATWDANSTCEINNLTAISPVPPSNLNQPFGNFRWNTPAMGTTSTFSLGGQLTSVSGNLVFVSSNRAIRFNRAGAGYTLNVGGNFDNQGAPLILADNLSSAVIVNVGGSYSQSQPTGPVPSFVFFAAFNAFDATVNISGGFSRTAGTISRGSASSSTVLSTFNFNGGTIQTYSYSGLGTAINTQINFSVASGTTLDVGTSSITGTGTFTLNGTLRLGSTDAAGAIQSGSTNGNIRVSGLRTFNSGSTVIYNGSGPQFMGSGHPSASNTQINNASGVTLASDQTVNGTLTLTSGNLNLGSNTLTIGSTFTANSNFLGVTSASGLVINGTGAFGNFAISGGPTINNFTLNRSGGSITLASDLNINGTFTQTVGDINLNGNTLTVGGPYSRTSGNIAGSSTSSVIFNGSGTLPSTVGISGGALNTFTMNRAGTTLISGSAFSVSNLNVLSGTFQNDGTITMASGGAILTRNVGTVTGSGTITAVTSYDVLYTNSSVSAITTGPELPASTTQLRNLTINSTGQVNLNSAITVNGILTFTSGVFNAGSNAIDLKGNLVSNNPSQLTNSSITFSGNTTVSGAQQVTFGNITVTGTGTLTPTSDLRINGNLVNNGTLNSGSGTVTFGGSTTISGTSVSSFNNVVINSGSSLTASASTNLNVAGNWTNNGTFTHSSGTVAFTGTTSFSGTGLFNFGAVTITGTVNAPTSLGVARDFTNNGTFNRGSGTVLFNGTATQSIAGSTATTFNNITVTNTAGPPAVQVQSNQNLAGVLTLSANSRFDADGSSNSNIFRLLSTADNPTVDASIAELPSGALVTGNVTVQRHMAIEGSNSNRIYRYISSPVSGAQVSAIQAFIPVTGPFTGASTCSGCASGTASMFTYDETVTTGDLNTGYTGFPVAANTETLAVGRGYAIFVRGNINPVSGAGSALYEVRGPVFTGDQSLPVSYTSSGTNANDGWNMVGNPYASTIDWQAAGWTKTNINDAIYMRDNGQSSPVIASFVGGVPQNGGSRYIAQGQAFFVKSDGGTPVLTARESIKVAGTQTTFFRDKEPSDVLRIALAGGGATDEAVIRFHEEATTGFDGKWDAYKLKNAIFNLASITPDNTLLAINSLPPGFCGTQIRLDVANISPGTYTLTFSGFETFTNSAMRVRVVDKFANKELDARTVANYAFQVTSDPASFGSNRFVLNMGDGITPAVSAQGAARCDAGAVTLSASGGAAGRYAWYESSTGPAIPAAVNATFVTPTLDKTKTYYVSALNESGCAAPRVAVVATIVGEAPPLIQATAAARCGPGQVSLGASGAEEGRYRWYETAQGGSPIPGVTGATFMTPALQKSRTYFVSAVNSNQCEGERKPVEATVTLLDPVLITEEAGVLSSNYAAGNQWLLDGVPIQGATSNTYRPVITGKYGVIATASGCTTSSEIFFLVTGLETSSTDHVSVYPNPVIEKVRVTVQSENEVQVRIVNLLGILIHQKKLEGGKIKEGQFDMQSHADGLYLVLVQDGLRTYQTRLIKGR